MSLRCLPLFALAVSTLLACSTPIGTSPQSAAAVKPKIVVLLAVDGLPQRQLLEYRSQLGPDGLARLLDRGAWFSQAFYGHGVTATGPGHAVMLSGAYPHKSGIIGNNWSDPATGDNVYCTGDVRYQYIGHTTQPLDGTSPRNMKVETVGDVLRRSDAQAKVISISGKDRGAILPAGQSGTAYMYMSASGQFASSSYYMKTHPAWVDAFNAAKPADQYFKTQWRALLPEAAYARSVADNQPWFSKRGGPGALPKDMSAPSDTEPGPRFYEALLVSPFADALSLDFALAAIAGEQLGQRSSADMLAVSLSSHDYINHAYGAESRLSHDHVLQLDRLLQGFFKALDTQIGPDNYVLVFTADHGFMPAPEYSASLGKDSGRLNIEMVLARINAALEPQFGAGKWVAHSGNSASLVLNKKLMTEKNTDADALAEATRQQMLAQPGIAAAYTRRELLAPTPALAAAPFYGQLRKTWHPEVSGQVQFVLKPNWMIGRELAATHGSPHDYDTHVPIAIYGPRWAKPGQIDTRVEVADIAPTVARWLGVAAPAASEGKPLPLSAP